MTSGRNLIVHASTANMGGGELSLLASLDTNKFVPFFILPIEGSLSEAIKNRGWQYVVLKWPKGFDALSQKSWAALPLKVFGIIGYELKLISILKKRIKADSRILSSGIKSHFFCLLISPWLRANLLFDIRDFIRPLLLRRLINYSSQWFGCEVRANSKAVAKDFLTAKVNYPIITGFTNTHKPLDSAKFAAENSGKKIITHLAYFAPYKGQLLFLNCARELLDNGVDAEFWLVGEVIYPAKKYLQYREKLLRQVESLKLGTKVKFLGKLSRREDVAEVLAKTNLLLHCTIEPEPYGRSVMEALQSGCEVICHGGSGVCETTEIQTAFPDWAVGLANVLGTNYVSLKLPT